MDHNQNWQGDNNLYILLKCDNFHYIFYKLQWSKFACLEHITKHIPLEHITEFPVC